MDIITIILIFRYPTTTLKTTPRPPHSKIWGGRDHPIHPRIDACGQWRSLPAYCNMKEKPQCFLFRTVFGFIYLCPEDSTLGFLNLKVQVGVWVGSDLVQDRYVHFTVSY